MQSEKLITKLTGADIQAETEILIYYRVSDMMYNEAEDFHEDEKADFEDLSAAKKYFNKKYDECCEAFNLCPDIVSVTHRLPKGSEEIIAKLEPCTQIATFNVRRGMSYNTYIIRLSTYYAVKRTTIELKKPMGPSDINRIIRKTYGFEKNKRVKVSKEQVLAEESKKKSLVIHCPDEEDSEQEEEDKKN